MARRFTIDDDESIVGFVMDIYKAIQAHWKTLAECMIDTVLGWFTDAVVETGLFLFTGGTGNLIKLGVKIAAIANSLIDFKGALDKITNKNATGLAYYTFGGATAKLIKSIEKNWATDDIIDGIKSIGDIFDK